MGKKYTKGGSVRYCILGVTPDKYELPHCYYDNFTEMAAALGTSIQHCYEIVSRQGVFRKTKLRYEVVVFDRKDQKI